MKNRINNLSGISYGNIIPRMTVQVRVLIGTLFNCFFSLVTCLLGFSRFRVFRKVRELADVANNFTNSEMYDMCVLYIECGRQTRETVRVYACRYPERRQPHYKVFRRLDSRLQKYGQFRPIKPAGTYLLIRFYNNIILNIAFLS